MLAVSDVKAVLFWRNKLLGTTSTLDKWAWFGESQEVGSHLLMPLGILSLSFM